MSKRHRESGPPPTNWDSERTLEAAEADANLPADVGEPTACVCGNRDLLLQGFFAVHDGVLAREPIEAEALTCPECGREFEPVVLEGGRIARGEFVGWAELDEE